MKRKAVMLTKPKQTKASGEVLTAQITGEILILDHWKDRLLRDRYCINVKTGEFENLDASGSWKKIRLGHVIGQESWRGFDWLGTDTKEKVYLSNKDRRIIKENIQSSWDQEALDRIISKEKSYLYEKREIREFNRQERLKRLMDSVPAIPKDFKSWITERVASGLEYAFYQKKDKAYSCTACGRKVKETEFKAAKIRHRDELICPKCGHMVTVLRRKTTPELTTTAMLLQDIDEKKSVSRHFDIKIMWEPEGKKVLCSEAVRIFLHRKQRYAVSIYYAYTCKSQWVENSAFDKSNPCNRKIGESYLYPGGIDEALNETRYAAWERTFKQLAEAGRMLDYNALMVGGVGTPQLPTMTEYLIKGRFYRLLHETARNISFYSCQYSGPLNPEGENIEGVFGIQDRQRINRIRNINGGSDTLAWMQWSDEQGVKLNDETLKWLTEERVRERDVNWILDRMSPCQIMNYVRRQQAEAYQSKSARSVLSAWEDYLSMCEKLRKHTEDEMIFRPRELKRRHDEIVEEIRDRQEEIAEMEQEEAADRMRDKYPGAEEHLQEIRGRYEYQDNEYLIAVPKRLMEIVKEGAALHHCVGSSERYFERIRDKETYICFLRRISEPDKPYYTIEVEPGGTIRQHRSMYDEEPNIEQIRGFLRKWQKEIRKRLNEEDRKLAQISAEKRKKNLEELMEKNNTRVLKALEEDFMEAV